MKHCKMILSGLLTLAMTVLFSSCEKEVSTADGSDGPAAPESVSDLEAKGWKLVWSDEFNDPTPDGRPDPLNWSYELGNSGFGNQELQNYTDRAENACYGTYDGEGCLVISALKDNYDGITYSSARLKTEGKYEFKYGRFEARMVLPYGPGLWPAFWLLGGDYQENEWPACGEIDIMENKGYQPNIVSSALHMPGYSGGSCLTQTFGYEHRRFDTGFHVFAAEWDESGISFIVDGVTYKRIEKSDAPEGQWVFDHPFFIILNVAVGGTFGGNPVDATYFPQHMYVDYVRVYQRPEHIDPDANRGDIDPDGAIGGWNESGNGGDSIVPDKIK